MFKKISLMIMLLVLLTACATGVKGSITPLDVTIGIQKELNRKFYPNCTDIKPVEVVDIQPPEMKAKKVTVGDKWTERWKISACGVAKIHPIEFQMFQPHLPPAPGFSDWVLGFLVMEAE